MYFEICSKEELQAAVAEEEAKTPLEEGVQGNTVMKVEERSSPSTSIKKGNNSSVLTIEIISLYMNQLLLKNNLFNFTG